MLANFSVLDGGTLLAIQRSIVGAMVEASFPYQNGSSVCWQERQQWGDNPQWYPVCHPIPPNYLQPVYTGGGGAGVMPSPTVPDGVVRTQPVTKITDPVGGSVPTVPGTPKAPVDPSNPVYGGGSVDIVGGITGDYFGPVTQVPAPEEKPFPWGLLAVAALALTG